MCRRGAPAAVPPSSPFFVSRACVAATPLTVGWWCCGAHSSLDFPARVHRAAVMTPKAALYGCTACVLVLLYVLWAQSNTNR